MTVTERREARPDVAVGYAILAHSQPEQLLRLVRAIRSSSSAPVVVNVDRKAERVRERVDRLLGSVPDVACISTRKVGWGDFNAVEAVGDAARLLLDCHPHLTHVKHLSGQDYPLRPLAAFECWLDRFSGMSLIDSHPLPQVGHEDHTEHYRFLYVLRGRRRSLHLPWARRLPALSFHAGSAFWCLTREHLRLLDAVRGSNRHFFRGVLAPDEIFAQTLLASRAPESELVNVDLNWTRWTGDSSGPATMTENDARAALVSGAWFARKFDSRTSSEAMRVIDRQMLGHRP